MKENKFEKLIFSKLYSKYKIDNYLYSLNVIDNIVFNERSHLVSIFKDYLILDDTFEFLKRYYNIKDSNIKLKNFVNYYSINKKQFPNYSNIKEGKFILKNIYSKQQMIENLDKSIKPKNFELENVNIVSKENLSNTVFNSKVYNSIINDSDNCLSVFSYDKESLYSSYNRASKNIKEDSINKLINKFDQEEPNANFSFGFKEDVNVKPDNSLIKDLKSLLESNNEKNEYNILKEKQKNQKIYKKKRTPNNSINKRANSIYNSMKAQKFFAINNNENIDYLNYKNLVLYSENNHYQMNNAAKKTTLSISPNSRVKTNNSSMPYLDLSKGNSNLNKKIKSVSYINQNENNSTKFKSKNNKINNHIKKIEGKVSNNLLTERLPQIIKVKINMKKCNNKNNKNQYMNKNKNNNMNKNTENPKQVKKIIKNKISFAEQNTENNYKKAFNDKNEKDKKIESINNNLIDENKKDFRIKSLQKINTYRSNSNNILKDNKINLMKKNIDYNIQTNYIFDKYKNKFPNYNNYTSIQFNNNNINIINPNSNTINHNVNDICYNTYGNCLQNYEDIKLFNNISNIGNNKSQEFKNRRKKINKKCATYFYSNKSEKLGQKFKFKKRLKFLANMNIINNTIETNNNNIKNNSQLHRAINSERISTPFNSRPNKKIFFKVYQKVNFSNNKDKKNQTIINDTYKRYKKNVLINNKIRETKISNNIDTFDNLNFTQMNSNNFNNSNFFNNNSSLYGKKKYINETEIMYYKYNDEKDLLKKNLDINISKIYKDGKIDKKETNNLGKILQRKKAKKDDEILEIKKLNERKKMIINQFNEQMNQIKLKFMKEIENKFEVKKRDIINKRKNKNKLNLNSNFVNINK